MKLRKILFLFLFLLLPINTLNLYAAEDESDSSSVDSSSTDSADKKKSNALAKLSEVIKALTASVANVFKNLAANTKTVLDNVDYNSDRLDLIFKINVLDKDWEFGFTIPFDFEGPGDIQKGFDPVTVRIVCPTLEEMGIFNLPVISSLKSVVPSSIRNFNIIEVALGTAQNVPKLLEFILADIRDKLKPYLGDVKELLQLTPDEVFTIKSMMLIFSSIKNKKLDDIPVQLGLLFARLKQSIDFDATIAANKGERDRTKWKKIVFFKGPSSFINKSKVPKFIRDIINSVKLNINAESYFAWQEDKKIASTSRNSAVAIAYSDVRSEIYYLNQVNKVGSALIPAIKKNIGYIDRKKVVYLMERLTFERIFAKKQSTIDLLKKHIDTIAEKFKDLDVNIKNAPFLSEMKSLHLKKLKDLSSLLSTYKVKPPEKPTKKAETEKGKEAEARREREHFLKTLSLEERFKAANAVELGPVYPNTYFKIQKQIPLPEFLDYLYFILIDSNARFYGDVGYLFDDSILNDISAIDYLRKVIFRMFFDLNKAVYFAKSSAIEIEAVDKNGNAISDKDGQIKFGKAAYDEYIGTPGKINGATWQVDEDGTGMFGEERKAYSAYKAAYVAYKNKIKAGASKLEVKSSKTALDKARGAWLKESIKLTLKKVAFAGRVFAHYAFERAPQINVKKVTMLLADKLNEIKDSDNTSTTVKDLLSEYLAKFKKEQFEAKLGLLKLQEVSRKALAAGADIDMEFQRGINRLQIETVDAFFQREVRLVIMRTKAKEKIVKFMDPFLEAIIGMKWQDMEKEVKAGMDSAIAQDDQEMLDYSESEVFEGQYGDPEIQGMPGYEQYQFDQNVEPSAPSEELMNTQTPEQAEPSPEPEPGAPSETESSSLQGSNVEVGEF